MGHGAGTRSLSLEPSHSLARVLSLARSLRRAESREAHRAVPVGAVVIGRGLTAVKIYMRLRLQKFVSPVSPQPFVRVLTMV
jgi:hypothetical protein